MGVGGTSEHSVLTDDVPGARLPPVVTVPYATTYPTKESRVSVAGFAEPGRLVAAIAVAPL